MDFEDDSRDDGAITTTAEGKYMTFRTGKEFFGIGINYVNEIIVMQNITTIPQVEDYIKGLINLRGKIIPVIDVRARFKMDPIDYTDRACIMVTDVGDTTIGLIVEEIAEVITVDDEDILPPPSLNRKDSEEAKYVMGLARTESGMKLLLDPEKLIRDAADVPVAVDDDSDNK